MVALAALPEYLIIEVEPGVLSLMLVNPFNESLPYVSTRSDIAHFTAERQGIEFVLSIVKS
jgi:hypothetical protein